MPRNEFMNHHEQEDLNQEDSPVEEIPQAATLADLRTRSGFTTTAAHIAQIRDKSKAPGGTED